MIEDAELTRRVRAGDNRAVAELYKRHHPAVLAFARRLCQDPQTAEDLAGEAFARTLRTVRIGAGGPSGAWRPYLYAVARNTATEWARHDQRMLLTAEFSEEEYPDLSVAEPQPPDELIVRAYRSLPPRWQTVLWHTLIEDETPDQVAEILGITPGNVAVLAFRAREGLRKAYLAAHVATRSPDCQQNADRLATAVRKPGARMPRALRAHLDTCPNCARAYDQLRDLNTTLRAGLPIALLPLATAKATASHGAFAGASGWATPAKITVWKDALARMPGWAIPATLAMVCAAFAIVLTLPDDSPPPATTAYTAPAPSPLPSREHTPKPTAKRTWRPTPKRTPKPTLKRAATPTAKPVAGARIKYASRCIAAAGGSIEPLPCADPRTAWHIRGQADSFQLVNVITGRCLSAGEKYDSAAFNGGGMRTVRLTSCSSASTQRWSTPGFSDGVPRLINNPTGMALSIGKEFAGKRPPTTFILYGPYTGSADQRITLTPTPH
ncbi:sigma-70 family RNA polymerase sigma factor [Sphaerisporangium fuscum]|uniref:sigma-70 family RNA polymerase sigma factor n=1 Tax=Sphaerisporangium fuscum TaxID=2835868 RepID=UPI001BDC596C|nr:sigma-70 family RNA polymerase sigma factor [Sphaerisporangium fuscum]